MGAPVGGVNARKVAEERSQYENIKPAQLGKAVAELEQQMFKHAENLEFEAAAKVRDEITILKERVLKWAE
jgi:excinuclease ABC subunit B